MARVVITGGGLTYWTVWYNTLTALGLAIFSAIATARTSALLTAHAPSAAALTAGFRSALLACAVFLLGAAVIGMRAANSRGEPVIRPAGTHAAREQVPAPELAD